MRGIPAHETPWWKELLWGRRSRPIRQGRARGNRARRRRRAKTHSFVGERDTHRCLTRSEDHWMWNPPRLQSRPADPRMIKTHPEDGPEKCSQEPNCSNSFTRDQIVRIWPEKGDPILKEYRPAIPRRLRFDRVGGNHTRPVGWPHREATKDRWMEEAFVPIECAEICNMTRYGWPHCEGLASNPREGARRVFVPIESWEILDP